MAQKKRKKRSWLRTALFFIFFPLVVWLVALSIWFYWYDITRLFGRPEERRKPAGKIDSQQERREKSELPPPSRASEKILDEDRKKLDDILKRRP